MLDINQILLLILGAIGIALRMIWVHFTNQANIDRDTILRQAEQAQKSAEQERARADAQQKEFLNALDKITKSNKISSDKRDKIMEEHLIMLKDLTEAVNKNGRKE
jgi:hypothetical protein